VLAVAATQLPGTSVIEGAAELRVKESDRIAAMEEGLREMGAEAATIQAKDAKGAENERDPVQDDAQQMSQAYAVHERFVNATNLATFQMANEMRSGQNYRLAFAEILSHLRPNTAIVEDLPLDRKGRFYEVESLVAYPISVWALRMDP